MRQLSGLEQLDGIARGELEPAPMAELMGFELIEVEEGFAAFEGEPTEALNNPMGTVHGGFAATMLDSAMGCAVHSTLPAAGAYSTLELSVNLVRPITSQTGRVRAEGRLVALDTGKLLAHGTTTCMIS